MRRPTLTWLVLPALLLLGACGGATTARAPALPETPDVAACREEARAAGFSNQEIARRQNFTDVNQMARIARLQEEAEQRAFRDCLRRRGLVRGGGVEPVRRTDPF
ncbi:MAG TPA: phosphoribosylamine--glycine ligase [Falsiroseomonas sp.]|jgi:hypothetical protein|nr:phosphoribosylamine--glycine ligase [Falsiroseomonas sp.]